VGALIERYARQATLLDEPPRSIMQDLNDLKHYEQLFWRKRSRDITGPTALLGFAGLEAGVPAYNLPTVTPAAATETALWPVANWTPIQNPNLATQQYPKAYRLVAFGTQTTPASQGTLTLTPRVGQVVGGITLGASGAIAQTASETNILWKIWGDLVLRIGGNASTATAVGHFHYSQQTGTASPGIVLASIFQEYGGTVASFDGSGTTALGLWMGVTIATSATSTFVPQATIWASWD
jgi:hypothetical protein